MWAQRHDTVLLTIEVFEVKNEKVDIKAEGISFAGTRGTDEAKFAINLELFGLVDPEASKVSVGHREVSVILKKAESGPYWPRLLKSTQKMHFVHTDFSKWKDEDEEEEEENMMAGNSAQDFSQFGNFAQFGGEGMGMDQGGFDEDFELEESTVELAEEVTEQQENSNEAENSA